MNDDQGSFDFDHPADESGYQLWKARTEEARKNKVETRPRQEGLDFENAEADESGYEKWQANLAEEKRQIEADFGLILGREIRVKIRQMEKEIEGVMHHRLRNHEVILSIGTLDFGPDDIESLVRV